MTTRSTATADAPGLRLVGELTPSEADMARWYRRRVAARAEEERRRAAFFAIGGSCWSCRDTGYLRGDRDLGAPCVMCAMGHDVLSELRAAWVAEQMRLAGVPRRMAGWSFASLPAEARVRSKRVRRFLDGWDAQSGRGLLLSGQSRVGKTGLLVAALRQVLERAALALDDPRGAPSGLVAARAWFITDVELLAALRDGYADGSARELLRRARMTPLLVIDDLGKADYREGEGWAAERLFEVVNARYAELRPTWFSTNLGSEQLAKRLGGMGEPILERILDACEALTITGAKLRSGRGMTDAVRDAEVVG